MALLLVLSLIQDTGFDLFDINAKHVQPKRCSLRCTFWLDFMAFMLWGLAILIAFVLAVTTAFGSLVWHSARMCFVQVGRLKRCCWCLRVLHCDSSDMNDALWMYIISLIQDVLLALASWLAVDITFPWGCYRCIHVLNISPSQKKGHILHMALGLHYLSQVPQVCSHVIKEWCDWPSSLDGASCPEFQVLHNIRNLLIGLDSMFMTVVL